MAGSPQIQCIGPSYQLADRKSAVQRAINFYIRSVEGVGENRPVVLDSAPGVLRLASPSGNSRGAIRTPDGRVFAVWGAVLYEVTDVAGTLVSLGSLASASGLVWMAAGRNEIITVDGTSGYVFNTDTATFSTITSAGWLGSTQCETMDGYAIYVRPASQQFYVSAADAAGTIDPLDFNSADTKAGNLVAERVLKHELWLFRGTSAEIWVDSGGADFPFTRYNGTPVDVGAVGPYAICLAADTMVMVGRTDRGVGAVYKMLGHQPVRVSDQAVEEAIAECTDLSQISMWTYHTIGNEFVGINGPGMKTTRVLDMASMQWHERAELVNGDYVPLRVTHTISAFDKIMALGPGALYLMDADQFSLDGDPLVRERTWPHLISPALEMVPYRGLELSCTTGGETAGNITLELSNDGGFTYMAPMMRSLGSIGRRMQKVRWLGLGSAYDRVNRLRCSDPVRLTIHAATLDAS